MNRSLIGRIRPAWIGFGTAALGAVWILVSLITVDGVEAVGPTRPFAGKPIRVIDPPMPATAMGKGLFGQAIASVEQAGASVTETASTTDTPPPPPPEPPRLVGLATAGNGRAVAVLHGLAGQDVMLRTGERMDGWQIIRIEPHSVTLRLNGRVERVSINPSSNAPGGNPSRTASAAPSLAVSAPSTNRNEPAQ